MASVSGKRVSDVPDLSDYLDPNAKQLAMIRCSELSCDSRETKLLSSCLHPLCKVCSEAAKAKHGNGQLLCPKTNCGAVSEGLVMNVMRFIDDYNRMQNVESQKLCQISDCEHARSGLPTVAHSYCEDCDKYMCASYASAHSLYIKECVNHKTKLVSFTSKLVPVCPRHSEKLSVYCNVCSVFACSKCWKDPNNRHAGHSTLDSVTHGANLIKILKQSQEELNTCLNPLVDGKDSVELYEKKFENNIRVLLGNIDDLIQEFNTVFIQWIEFIHEFFNRKREFRKKRFEELKTLVGQESQTLSNANVMLDSVIRTHNEHGHLGELEIIHCMEAVSKILAPVLAHKPNGVLPSAEELEKMSNLSVQRKQTVKDACENFLQLTYSVIDGEDLPEDETFTSASRGISEADSPSGSSRSSSVAPPPTATSAETLTTTSMPAPTITKVSKKRKHSGAKSSKQ